MVLGGWVVASWTQDACQERFEHTVQGSFAGKVAADPDHCEYLRTWRDLDLQQDEEDGILANRASIDNSAEASPIKQRTRSA